MENKIMGQKVFIKIIFLAFALSFVPKAMSQQPSSVTLSSDYNEKNYLKVAQDSKNLLLIDPANESIKEMYALANFKLKNYQTVIDLYSDKETPYLTSPLQLKLRAVSLVRIGNFYHAMTALKALRNISPINPEWKDFYYFVVYKLNPKNTLFELRRMGKISPSFANDFITGKLYALEGRDDIALTFFNQALTKDINNKDVLEAMGDSYYKIKNYDGAISIYGLLLSKHPDNSKFKIKTSKALVKQGRYVDAIKMLEENNHPQAIALKEKISILANRIVSGGAARTIAEEKIELNSVTGNDGKLVLEEKFIPKEIDIYVDSSIKNTEKVKLEPTEIVTAEVVNTSPVELSEDVSTLELGFSLNAKKFALTGTGFTANVEYSTGASLDLKYIFSPKERNWKTYAELDYSTVELKKLSGITPSRVTLTKAALESGVNYTFGNFSVGPSLMYERLNSTQASPSTLRGNVDFVNLGIKSAYMLQVLDKLKLNVDINYFFNVMSNSKTASVGPVDSHSLIKGSGKLYYEMRPRAYIFAGLEYAKMFTQYVSSSGRGTIGAKETETDISFPLGINYDF